MQLNSNISAIITGGASGLGEATARALAKKGVKVALFDMNGERGEKVAGEIGGVFCKVNVTSDDDVVAGFAKARSAHGQERIFVNCAGIGPSAKTASRDKTTGAPKTFPIDVFNSVIQVNLVGTFRCASNSAAGMLTLDPLEDGERGVIINTASIAAEDGQIGQAAYASSKAGVVGLTLVIARDLGADGIRCNTIMPGIMDTPMMEAAPEHLRQALYATIPFPKRFGRAEEYANLALALMTNTYINGESIRMDGATRMPPR